MGKPSLAVYGHYRCGAWKAAACKEGNVNKGKRKEPGGKGTGPRWWRKAPPKKLTAKWLTTAHCLQKMQCDGYLCPAAKQSSELYLQSIAPLLPLSSWSSSQVPANSSSLLACCKVPWLVVGASSSARGTESLSGVCGE